MVAMVAMSAMGVGGDEVSLRGDWIEKGRAKVLRLSPGLVQT